MRRSGRDVNGLAAAKFATREMHQDSWRSQVKRLFLLPQGAKQVPLLYEIDGNGVEVGRDAYTCKHSCRFVSVLSSSAEMTDD